MAASLNEARVHELRPRMCAPQTATCVSEGRAAVLAASDPWCCGGNATSSAPTRSTLVRCRRSLECEQLEIRLLASDRCDADSSQLARYVTAAWRWCCPRACHGRNHGARPSDEQRASLPGSPG